MTITSFLQKRDSTKRIMSSLKRKMDSKLLLLLSNNIPPIDGSYCEIIESSSLQKIFSICLKMLIILHKSKKNLEI